MTVLGMAILLITEAPTKGMHLCTSCFSEEARACERCNKNYRLGLEEEHKMEAADVN